VPRVATLGVLVLCMTASKSATPGQSHVKILVQFGNNYWVIMVGLILGLLVAYKVFPSDIIGRNYLLFLRRVSLQ